MKRIGIFSGSFDPCHVSHLAIIDECIKRNLVDEVWVLPSSRHCQKNNVATFEHRLKMCKLLFEKPFNHVKVKDLERFNPSGATIHMVLILMEMFKKYHFSIIIGQDCADNIKTWVAYQKLIDMVPFIIFEREDYTTNMSTWYLTSPHHLFQVKGKCFFSSTYVRKLLGEKKFVCAGVITGQKVIKYIQKNGLYIPTDIPPQIEKWMDEVIKEQKI